MIKNEPNNHWKSSPKRPPNPTWTLESINSTDIQGKTNSCFNYRGFYEIVGEYPTKLLMSQIQRKSCKLF